MTEKREKEIEDIVSVLDDALLDLINVSGKGLNDIHTMVMIKHLAEAISKHYVRRDDVGIDVDKLANVWIEYTTIAGKSGYRLGECAAKAIASSKDLLTFNRKDK